MSDALMDVARVLMLSESRSVFFVGALEGGGEKSGRLTRSMFNVEDFQDGGAIVGWGIKRGDQEGCTQNKSKFILMIPETGTTR